MSAPAGVAAAGYALTAPGMAPHRESQPAGDTENG